MNHLADSIFCLMNCRASLSAPAHSLFGHPEVAAVDPQVGHAARGQLQVETAVAVVQNKIRDNVRRGRRAFVRIAVGGLRVQVHDLLQRGPELVLGHPQPPHHPLVMFLDKLVVMVGQYRDGQFDLRRLVPQGFQLNDQAFAQVPRPDPRRVEHLDDAHHAFHLVLRHFHPLRESNIICNGGRRPPEVAVVVERPDHEAGDGHLLFGEVVVSQLFDQEIL